MENIGLDFGTTNSIISYCNGDQIRSFQIGGVGETSSYVPSCVSISQEDNESDIGQLACLNLGNQEYQVFRWFKILLSEQNPEVLEKNGFIEKTPKNITKLFLETLIKTYTAEQNLQKLNNIVITVPEIWVREGRHAARECLKQVCKELNLPVHKMLSEPVAAAVYFSKRFKEQAGQDFSGHILVVDYGGGTLDLNLSEIQGDNIRVLAGSGKGYSSKHVGAAGVAFDEAVVQRLYKKAGHQPKDNLGRYYKHLKEFELQKIGRKRDIDRRMKQYLTDTTTNRRLFLVDDFAVTSEDLLESFSQTTKEFLEKALAEMKGHLERHSVKTEDGTIFRILMVGGFSNFFLVQHAVKQFFDVRTDEDTRFKSPFNSEDTGLAISKGAAMVANGHVNIEHVCPISVGIRVKAPNFKDKDILILKQGETLRKYITPEFSKITLHVINQATLRTSSLVIFLDVGNGKRRYIELAGSLEQLLPKADVKHRWEIGFSVDEDLLFDLHIRDENNKIKITSLGNLESKIGGLHIWEENHS